MINKEIPGGMAGATPADGCGLVGRRMFVCFDFGIKPGVGTGSF